MNYVVASMTMKAERAILGAQSMVDDQLNCNMCSMGTARKSLEFFGDLKLSTSESRAAGVFSHELTTERTAITAYFVGEHS